jgi:SLA1 Homology Domain 1 (SHD1) protein
MRSLGTVLLFVLFAAPMRAEERTWTISTGTYAMAAELVEVRGDIAYLKTADRIEHIPLARLSAADLQYLASQSPSVIFPGPADDSAIAESLPTPANEYNALPPGESVGPVINDAAPVAAPAVTRESQKPVMNSAPRVQTPGRVAPRYTQSEELLPGLSSSAPVTSRTPSTSRAVKVDPRTLRNPNLRRSNTSPKQIQNNSANRNRSRDDERPGLFGFRSRR